MEATAQPGRAAVLYFDRRVDELAFAAGDLTHALERAGHVAVSRPTDTYTGGSTALAIVVTLDRRADLPREGFDIVRRDATIRVNAVDPTGGMYGMLDVAETIRAAGLDAVVSKRGRPFLEFRGVKFNLPFEPFDQGEPFEANEQTCLDPAFWTDYIDFLARHRYNLLSLWSEHPFHVMVRVAKYPQTCPYSDAEMKQHQALWRHVFDHAMRRGLQTFLITWNIRITPVVARGLGLPEAFGEMGGWYDTITTDRAQIANPVRRTFAMRQHNELVRDYFVEALTTLLQTYPELSGIGTSASEEMVGDGTARVQWVTDVYAEAVRRSGRDLPFIHRTNMMQGAKNIIDLFMPRYPGKRVIVSWKYSNAHMYSHPLPQFEKLWKAWEGVDETKVERIYTVRNDDAHTLRLGDPAYIREHLRGLAKPGSVGFYWGADGYTWGRDFQSAPHLQRSWRWDFQKHWFQFMLLGRIGYDPQTPDELWHAAFAQRFGPAWGALLYRGIVAASRIIPPVNRQFWIDYDFEWHPESLLSVYGLKTVIDFMNTGPMPGVGTVGLRQHVENELAGRPSEGETLIDVLGILDGAVADVEDVLVHLEAEVPSACRGDEIGSTIGDLQCWRSLGAYYGCKLRAAAALVRLENTADEAHRNEAIGQLKQGVRHWRDLSLAWGRQYLPYRMARTKQVFGYPLWLDAVERDLALARAVTPLAGR